MLIEGSVKRGALVIVNRDCDITAWRTSVVVLTRTRTVPDGCQIQPTASHPIVMEPLE